MRSKSISTCLAKYICEVMVNFGDMLFDTVRKFGRACPLKRGSVGRLLILPVCMHAQMRQH